jgi:hypothetical protein
MENSYENIPKQDSWGDTIFYGILSFFIFVIGLILWQAWKDIKPRTANVCCIMGVIGFVALVTIMYLT